MHELRDAVVAEVADAALVSVVDVFVGLEAPGFYLEAYLLVGLAERCAGEHAAVHLLDGEYRVVDGIVQDVLVDLDALDDVGGDVEAVEELVEGGHEHLLDDLQVARVAREQIVHDERDLGGEALQLVALGSDQLEHVGVLLMGHDA